MSAVALPGDMDIANDALSACNARIQNVSMADSTSRLSLANANGELHWSAADTPGNPNFPGAPAAPMA